MQPVVVKHRAGRCNKAVPRSRCRVRMDTVADSRLYSCLVETRIFSEALNVGISDARLRPMFPYLFPWFRLDVAKPRETSMTD
jgi:hypothetical protein